MSNTTNPFHWSFYTKDDADLHTALVTLKADKTLFMSRVLAKAVKSGIRAQYPHLFPASAPATSKIEVTKKPTTKTKSTRT